MTGEPGNPAGTVLTALRSCERGKVAGSRSATNVDAWRLLTRDERSEERGNGGGDGRCDKPRCGAKTSGGRREKACRRVVIRDSGVRAREVLNELKIISHGSVGNQAALST